MRATGQTAEPRRARSPKSERRLVASRAILGEWLGGSGGGWQDSGGIWPGIKVIEGALARRRATRSSASAAGCLLPQPPRARPRRPAPGDHGAARGVARAHPRRHGAERRADPRDGDGEVPAARGRGVGRRGRHARRSSTTSSRRSKTGDVRRLVGGHHAQLGRAAQDDHPWVTNRFTETIIARARERLRRRFLGFPDAGRHVGRRHGDVRRARAGRRSSGTRSSRSCANKARTRGRLPFAMDPVVYDFDINEQGTGARCSPAARRLMPARYYALQVPELVRRDRRSISISATRRAGPLHRPLHGARRIVRDAAHDRGQPLPRRRRGRRNRERRVGRGVRADQGGERVRPGPARADPQRPAGGRIGLARNRLPVETEIQDIGPDEAPRLEDVPGHPMAWRTSPRRVAVMSLAAGVGSRWTTGAG